MSLAILPLLPAFFALAAAAPSAARPPSTSRDIESKVALESSVEKRLQAVLKKMLDTDDLIAIVNVDLLSDSERKEIEVMPGVPLKESPAVPSPLEIPPSWVRKITVTIYLDQGARDADAELARRTAEKMVGLNRARGDVLAVEKAAFRKPPAQQPKPAPKPFNFRGLLPLCWLLVACISLVVFHRSFVDPLLAVLKEAASGLKARSTTLEGGYAPKRPEEEKEEAPEALKTAAAAQAPERNATEDRDIPFAFIHQKDLQTLNMLIREEPPLMAAAVVHYLPAHLASQALAAMDPAMRAEVVTHISEAKLLNPSEIGHLESSIRSKIDYMMGGEDKLAEILDEAPFALQSDILSKLVEKDRALAERIAGRLVTVDDLALLDEPSLKILSRHVPVRSLAAAVKSSENVRLQVVPKLKTGLGEWLAQEIEFSKPLPPEIRDAEIRRVLRTLSQLVRDGKLVLERNLPKPPEEGGLMLG